jgi:hypothetical protein
MTTALLWVATLLCLTVTPWAGIPVAAVALLNELVRMVLLAGTPEGDLPPSFDE